MNRTQVLEKVGGLLLLPNTELATTKQVTEFYGVDQKVITWHFNQNREELEANGVCNLKFPEIKEAITKNSNSELNYQLELTPKGLGISPRGSNIFNKRAILLVGFMLRDSEVAQQVRNQALNIIENSSDEVKVFEITKEKELLMAIMFAENELERAIVINTHLDYVNRHKKQMEEML